MPTFASLSFLRAVALSIPLAAALSPSRVLAAQDEPGSPAPPVAPPAAEPSPSSPGGDVPLADAPPEDDEAVLRSVRGVQVGVRTGYARALDAQAPSLAYATPSLVPLTIDVGYRTSAKVYFGVVGQIAIASRSDCASTGTCAAKEFRLEPTFQYHFAPVSRFDPWFGVGAGFELLHVSGVPADSGAHIVRTGIVLADTQLGLGIALANAPRAPRLGPFVGFAYGVLTGQGGRAFDRPVRNATISDYQWAQIGIRGTYDL